MICRGTQHIANFSREMVLCCSHDWKTLEIIVNLPNE